MQPSVGDHVFQRRKAKTAPERNRDKLSWKAEAHTRRYRLIQTPYTSSDGVSPTKSV